MRLFFFGRLSAVAGGRQVDLDPPAGIRDLAGLRDWLAQRDPELGKALQQPDVFTVVDDEVARGDRPLAGVAEVAFMPAVSGG